MAAIKIKNHADFQALADELGDQGVGISVQWDGDLAKKVHLTGLAQVETGDLIQTCARLAAICKALGIKGVAIEFEGHLPD